MKKKNEIRNEFVNSNEYLINEKIKKRNFFDIEVLKY